MAGRKSAIAFGLVYIPVELYTAAHPEEISFNQLAKDTMERVRYVKTCPDCKRELKKEDIVRAYQYEKGKYVTVSDEELEAIKTEKDKTLKIVQFSDPGEIPPLYYQKAYRVVAQEGGEKVLELLRLAMAQENKAAIGTTVMGESENAFALIPYEEGLTLVTLFYENEIKEIPKAVKHPKVSKQELAMAKDIIKNLEKPFDLSAYKDEYQEKLRALLEGKIAGKEVVFEQEEAVSANIIDLMEALSASVEVTKTKPARKKSVS